MTDRRLKIAVIGAGASGVIALVQLRAMGQDDVTIFERASSMGGTWRDNRYPGIACDVPSHLYRFSFAPNPDWTHVYSPGAEILEYMRGVFDREGVGRHVVFDTDVRHAAWADGAWTLETSRGTRGPFDVVITAMGVLRVPAFPDIPGLGTFAGRTIHTAQWDEALALEGRRVGIVGTGSTATQIVPAIVDRVAKLSLFQRTAQWIMPVPNDPIPEAEKAQYRNDPAALAQKYAHLASRFNSRFAAAIVGENPEVYAQMTQLCEQHLRDGVRDPDLRARLTPDYKVGCKRLIMSDSFYDAIQRPNAELVTDAIERIEPEGIRTRDGRLHPLDVLVLATGFDAHATFDPMTVSGRGGRTIADAWADGAQAYLAVTTPGFPNFFMIGGPGSPIGNFSFLMTAEKQCAYVLELVGLLASGAAREVAPTPEATRAYLDAVQERMKQTVWVTGCRSWYMDRSGHIASWPWSYERFEQAMSAPVLADYEVVPA